MPILDLGISIAYWLSFGLAFIDHGYADIRWRFLLAFQCIPAVILALSIKMLPDSPRFLASAGRTDEAWDLLVRIRRHRVQPKEIEREYSEIVTSAHNSKPSSPIQFFKILAGKGGRPGSSLGRRAWLSLFLQIMASWTGITVRRLFQNMLAYFANAESIGSHGILARSAQPGRIQRDKAEWARGWLEHDWYYRHDHQCADYRPDGPSGMSDAWIYGAIHSSAYCTFRACVSDTMQPANQTQTGCIYEGSLHSPEKSPQFAPAAVAMLFLFNLG